MAKSLETKQNICKEPMAQRKRFQRKLENVLK